VKFANKKESMKRILEGVARFQRDVFPEQKKHFEQLARSQSPEYLFITCSDSRVVPSLITQTEPGELFIIRNVGNVVPPYGYFPGGVSAAMEYAVVALNVRHIVVCGHTDCGAMKGILYPESVREMPSVAKWLHHGDAARQVVRDAYTDLDGDERLPAITRENVAAQLRNLATHPYVAARQANGTLEVHGWVYNIGSGEVLAYDSAVGKFRPLGWQEAAAD
jgi:carbonic anhydrase